LATLRSLASALEQEKKWAEAESFHREALAQWQKRAGPDDPQVIYEIEALARMLIFQKKFDDAAQLLNETLTPAFLQQPSSVSVLALRIDLRGRRGQWQDAESDAALALKHQPNNPERYHVLATLLAKRRTGAGYEDVCRGYFAKFRETTNVYVADQLAKTCLLLPSPEADLKTLDRLADLALTHGTGDKFSMPFFQVCKGLCEYRQGNFSEAVAWAQKALESSSLYSHGQAYAVLAMAYWRLEQKDPARAMLEKGNLLAPSVIPARDTEDPGKAWLAWLYARIALDEAAALIEAGKR
jgi:tetratricopeptide (TPR) repeat protein